MEYIARSPDQLASALKTSRRRRRLTQATVGSIVGVGQSHLSMIEGHGAKATIETLYKLLSALNLELVLREAPVGAEPSRSHPPASTRLVRAGGDA